VGDAVNIAARLEQAAAPGEILLGPETVGLVRDAVRVQALEPMALKGKSNPVAVCRLVEVLVDAGSPPRRLDTQWSEGHISFGCKARPVVRGG
jgi:class 3 adenylate cyclase